MSIETAVSQIILQLKGYNSIKYHGVFNLVRGYSIVFYYPPGNYSGFSSHQIKYNTIQSNLYHGYQFVDQYSIIDSEKVSIFTKYSIIILLST